MTSPHSDPAIEVLRAFDEPTKDQLRTILFNDAPEKRAKWEKVIQDPVFDYKFDMPLSQMRDVAYSQIKAVADAGIVSIFDFQNDPKNIFTAHEMLG